MTAVVNEIRSPLSFIKNMAFPTDDPQPTKNIEIDTILRGRHIAPLVKRGGAALMTTGHDENMRIVQPAHIRIKRPMHPTELLNKRRAGSVIHVGAAQVRQAMRAYMARELQNMSDDIDNTLEYLCAQALQGSISYESEDEVSFSVDFQRSASHTVTLTGSDLWTNSASNPSENFLQASQLINDDSEGVATDAILGANARAAFLANADVEKKLAFRPEFFQNGQLTIRNTFDQNGALFLGEYSNGIRVWSYARQLTLPDGTVFDLIRPDYAEFIWRSPMAERVVYYGAIEDMKAIGEGNLLQARRFSKSWEEEDPSARMALIESNPLPCMRRPDTTVSMKVV